MSIFVMWIILFCFFRNQTEVNNFFALLNTIHPALKFTLEKENNFSVLPFLDVLVCKTTSGFLTTIYGNFTGLYIRWDSFCPKKSKINLIKTLTHRALMICSKSKLDDEISFISDKLCNDSFPEGIVRSVTRIQIYDFNKIKPKIVQKCSVVKV